MLELDREIYIFSDRWFSALTCMHSLDTRVIHKDRDANIISPTAQTEKSVNVETLKTNKNSISLIKVSSRQFKIPHRTHFSRALFYFNLTVFAFGLQSNVLIYYFASYTFSLRFHLFTVKYFHSKHNWSGHLYQMPIWNGFMCAEREKIEQNLHMKP